MRQKTGERIVGRRKEQKKYRNKDSNKQKDLPIPTWSRIDTKGR